MLLLGTSLLYITSSWFCIFTSSTYCVWLYVYYDFKSDNIKYYHYCMIRNVNAVYNTNDFLENLKINWWNNNKHTEHNNINVNINIFINNSWIDNAHFHNFQSWLEYKTHPHSRWHFIIMNYILTCCYYYYYQYYVLNK